MLPGRASRPDVEALGGVAFVTRPQFGCHKDRCNDRTRTPLSGQDNWTYARSGPRNAAGVASVEGALLDATLEPLMAEVRDFSAISETLSRVTPGRS
jgi:hypothetical protein